MSDVATFASLSKLAEFLEGLVTINQPVRDGERREHPRGFLFGYAEVQPLEGGHRPVGESFMVTVRDISPTGLGFFHHEPLDARHLAVSLLATSRGELCVHAEVLRCRPVRATYEIGCRFLSPEQPDRTASPWSESES